MFVMVLGVGMYGFVIGNISQLLSREIGIKKRLEKKIADLQTFMRHYNVPRKVQVDTLDYVNTLLGKRLSDNDSQIIADLPKRTSRRIDHVYEYKINQVAVVFDQCGAICLKQVAQKLQKKSYSPPSDHSKRRYRK